MSKRMHGSVHKCVGWGVTSGRSCACGVGPRRVTVVIADIGSKVIATILSFIDIDVYNNRVAPYPVIQANNYNCLRSVHYR